MAYENTERPRTFTLLRHRDETGVSGEGAVADGAVFADGTAVLHWRSQPASTSVWRSFEDLISVHGHGGATVPEFHETARALL